MALPRSQVAQEGIRLAFLPDRGRLAVPGKDGRFVGKGKKHTLDRAQYLLVVAAPQVSAADAALEEGIAAEDSAMFAGQVKRNAARRMAGCVEDFELERSPAQHVAFLQELVDFDRARRRDTQPCGLHRQVPIQRQIAFVHQDLRAGSLLEFLDAAHVVDVGVRGDDVFGAQVVPDEDFLDALDIVAGVDHHGVSRGFVADNRAVALEHSDRDDFVDHSILDFGFAIFDCRAGAWTRSTPISLSVGPGKEERDATPTKSGSAPAGPSDRRACTRTPRQMRACWTGPRWP